MGTQILFIFCHQLVELCANKNKGGLMRRQVLKKLCKITRLMISDVWFIIIIIIINSIRSEAQSHLPKNIYNIYHPQHQQLPPYM